MIGPVALPDLLEICHRMRACDIAELSATRYGWDPVEFAHECFYASTLGWIAYHNEKPVAAIGFSVVWPGVANLWAFGTDDWPKVVKVLTRHVKRVMFPTLARMGIHRLQTLALANRQDADRFIRFFGATVESEMKAIGRNGEDFRMYRILTHELFPSH